MLVQLLHNVAAKALSEPSGSSREYHLKLLRESASLRSVSRECRASTGSLRRPAVPKRKMGVLSHCCPGTTASAHSSSGPSALVYSPACKHA